MTERCNLDQTQKWGAGVGRWNTHFLVADWATAQEAQVCTTTSPPLHELKPDAHRSLSFTVSSDHAQFRYLLRVDRLLLQRAQETEILNKRHWSGEPMLDFCCYCLSYSIFISISRKKTIKGCILFFYFYFFLKKAPRLLRAGTKSALLHQRSCRLFAANRL